jgi:hypothetical protein
MEAADAANLPWLRQLITDVGGRVHAAGSAALSMADRGARALDPPS